MAGHGSHCQQFLFSRWIHVASGLRSSLDFSIWMVAVVVATCQISVFADEPISPSSLENLRIHSAIESIVYRSEETVEFTAQVRSLTEHASRRLNLRTALLRVSNGEQVATDRQILPIDASGNSEPIEIKFVAPAIPGVYEVRFELVNDDDTLWGRFRKSKPQILRVGRPIFVVPQEATNATDGVSKASRLALISLPNLDWIETFVDAQPYRLSSDEAFDSECDSRTDQAMKLWTATERLKSYLQTNEMTGIALTGDYGGNSMMAELAGADAARQLETLVKVINSQDIVVHTIETPSTAVVDLRKSRRGSLPTTEWMLHRDELAIASVLNTTDPNVLILDVPIEDGSLSEPARMMLRSFVASPAQPLMVVTPVDPANTTVQVRAAMESGHCYLRVLSLAPWASDVDLEFSAAVAWSVVGDAAEAALIRQPEAPSTHLRIAIGPGQLVLLKTDTLTADLSIRSWSAVVSGGSAQVERIKRDVTLIVERIGLLTDLEPAGSLSNGGFEKTGGIGLVGWMHAQHPPGCVKIDDTESAEGKHSVLLTTDPAISARTWIVSEPLEPSATGRLAVSMVARAERQEDSPPHPMRVSIEATRNGEPIRYSGDFDVPRNGHWGSRQIVLEVDEVQKQSVDSLRLTIDSLARGRVWLDDVRIHHRFPTTKERDELQSQAFLAVQGLQHGNLSPSARLLQNRWARYLLTLGPAKDAKPIADNATSPKQPGVTERIRNWLPRPIRF